MKIDNGYIVNSINFFVQIKDCPVYTENLLDCEVFETKQEMYDYLVDKVGFDIKYIQDQELVITLNKDDKPVLCHLDGHEIDVIESHSVETYLSFVHG